ncbi:tripartite tricarboxylate transporter TctB family protein [Erwinia sp. Eh17-17]|jgi:putative tricarboxylic transport membrane protein|uniref:tripartite tricarboxylate transporter TctB family protein n=1 Tax=Erwinia sp. Eh17-17 TaxID=3080330 RepID=UPI003207F04B
MSDRIFASVWLLLCIIGLFIAWNIQSEYSYEPVGPRPFPMIILGLMALCAFFLLIRQPDAIQWPARGTLQRLLLLMVSLGLYGAVFESLGFPLATTLLTFVIGLLFGAAWWAAALSGVVMGAVLYYAFDRLLEVTLPLGTWLS